MNETKNVLMFGNKNQMMLNNGLIIGGIASVGVGIITIVIGGGHYYKTVSGIVCEDQTSNIINDMFEDLTKTK